MADDANDAQELEPGMIFRTGAGAGDVVRLDRRVPGDGTQWEADSWSGHARRWLADGRRLEPDDLGDRLPDDWRGH